MFWIQLIGLLGSAFLIFSYQFKKISTLTICQCIGVVLFGIHYALLKSLAGGLIEIVSLIRIAYILIKKDRFGVLAEVLICLSYIAVCVTTIVLKLDSWYAVIPCVACIIQTIAIFSNNDKTIRYMQLCGASPCWLTYNILYRSIGGSVCEIFTLISTIVYLIRTRKDKMKNNCD